MVTDKRKNDLFKKIWQYRQLIVERSELENDSEFTVSDLYDVDDEYAGICVQVEDLRDEIDVMLLDSKYAPIVGLTHSQFDELSFFVESSEKSFERNIEKHLDFRLLTLKDEMKKRLKQVKALRLCSDLDSHVRYLYSEIIDCYIKGAFEASSVLCRAVSEFLLKKFIEKNGKGHLLKGERNDINKISLPGIAKKYKLLLRDMIDIYYEIMIRANEVLHKHDRTVSEEQALASIEQLQKFIGNFPK